MGNVRVGIIGGGNRGKGHIRSLQGFDDVDVVAVCDQIAEARAGVCSDFGIEGQYDGVETMLEQADLDAVFVTTPPHLNGKLALPCLEAGVHTFIEKPPGLSVAETEGLKAVADRTGAKAMVGWNRRFNTFIVEARDRVLARGPVTQLVGEFHKSITQLANSGKFTEAMMDQMFLETPIHSVDTIRFLADSEVAEVHAYVRRSMSKYRDVHAALVVFENGVVAQMVHNYTTDARLERYEIHGHNISAYLEGVNRGDIFCEGKRQEIGSGSGGTDEQNRFFIDCVKNDTPVGLPGANLEEAVKTMALMEAILEGTR